MSRSYKTRLRVKNADALGSLFKRRLETGKISYLVTINGPMLLDKKTFKGNLDADGCSSSAGVSISSDAMTAAEAKASKTGKSISAYWQLFDSQLDSRMMYDNNLKMNIDVGQRIWFGSATHFFGEQMGMLDWNEAQVKPYFARAVGTLNQGEIKPTVVYITNCPHQVDGAVDVAEYIVQEIKTNVKSADAKLMRYFTGAGSASNKGYLDDLLQRAKEASVIFKSTNMAAALGIWTNNVYYRHKWDHKHLIFAHSQLKKVTVKRKLNALKIVREMRLHQKETGLAPKDSQSYWHKYKKHDYFYDVWSNIHYGYVGLSCGFRPEVLLAGASKAQALDNKTSNGDAPDDVLSIKIGFYLYAIYGDFAEGLTADAVLLALESTNFSESRDTHLCIHPNKKELENDGTV